MNSSKCVQIMIDTNIDMLNTVMKAILIGGLMKLPNNLDLGKLYFILKQQEWWHNTEGMAINEEL